MVGAFGEYAFFGVPVDPESYFGFSEGLRNDDGGLVFPHNPPSFEFRIHMTTFDYVGYVCLDGFFLTTKRHQEPLFNSDCKATHEG